MIKSKRKLAAEHVSVRLLKDDIERIDALIERCTTKWHQGTRSEVVRMLLLTALERVEHGGALVLKPLTPLPAARKVP